MTALIAMVTETSWIISSYEPVSHQLCPLERITYPEVSKIRFIRLKTVSVKGRCNTLKNSNPEGNNGVLQCGIVAKLFRAWLSAFYLKRWKALLTFNQEIPSLY